jgi:hypothetical protein
MESGDGLSLKGVVSFAIGGTLLIFALYFVISDAQSPYSGLGSLINGIALSFATFLLLGIRVYMITESAVSSKR